MKQYIVLFITFIIHCVECFSQTNCILDSTLIDQIRVHWSSSYDKLFQNHPDSVKTTNLRTSDIRLINEVISKRKIIFFQPKALDANCVYINLENCGIDVIGIVINQKCFKMMHRDPICDEVYKISKNKRKDLKKMLSYYQSQAGYVHLTNYYGRPMVSYSRYIVPHFCIKGFAIINFYIQCDSLLTNVKYYVSNKKGTLTVSREVVLSGNTKDTIENVGKKIAIYKSGNNTFGNSNVSYSDISIEKNLFENWTRLNDEEKMRLLDWYIK